MNDLISAAKQALEALDAGPNAYLLMNTGGIANKLRQAIAEAEKREVSQEPVAYRYKMPVEDDHWVWNYCTYPDNKDDPRCEPLYTHPPVPQGHEPKREPLTDEQCLDLAEGCTAQYHDLLALCRAIEAAHGIKENT